jgi:GT2 family glycosyltransferase
MLVKCDAIGTGSLLIKRNVIESIDPLWFEYKPYPKEEERFKTQSEDVVFCEKVRKAGFDIYCDSSVKCGHIGHMIVWPDSTQKVRVEPL